MPENEIKYTLLSDPGEVDLTSHVFMEASAGTGKTYTIRHLYGRILQENRVRSLEDILVLTYTEKATSDLKKQIRGHLLEMSQNGETSPQIRDALDNFDRAAIFTIHGFCNRVLRSFAFETGVAMNLELVPSRIMHDRVLREVFEDMDPRSFKGILASLLEQAQAGKGTHLGGNRLISILTSLLQRTSTQPEPCILPEPGDTFEQTLNDLKGKSEHLMASIGKLTDGNASILQKEADSLIFKGNMVKKIMRSTVTPLTGLLEEYFQGREALPCLIDLVSAYEYGSETYREQLNKTKKESPSPDEAAPILKKSFELLDIKLPHLGLETLGSRFIVELYRRIINRRDSILDRESLITYDQMLTRVFEGITHPSSDLKRRLQERYRYALVDEFQDTDPVQWQILSNLFLNETHHLLMIGDPKQAIYSFRGADIDTYFTARKEFMKRKGARCYTLNTNWRSHRNMTGAFNHIFREGWFNDDQIHYVDNRSPVDNEQYQNRFTEKDDSAIPITVIPCLMGDSHGNRIYYIERAAEEIEKLKSERFADYSDFAILTRNRDTMTLAESVLRKRGIPCAVYRKSGLYQSRECFEFITLLRALHSPGEPSSVRASFLTSFFSLDIESALFSPAEKEYLLLNRWSILASERQWSRLFHSLFQDSPGLMKSSRISNDSRRAFLQLMRLSSEITFREEIDLKGLIRWLVNRREDTSSPEEDMHEVDPVRAGVQIMTIHASKGLQFPVVFVAGGIGEHKQSESQKTDFFIYHTLEQRGDKKIHRRCFDLTGNSSAKEMHLEEFCREEERIFYVALTRASHRLYLPALESSDKTFAGIFHSIPIKTGDRQSRFLKAEKPGPFTSKEVKAEEPSAEKEYPTHILDQVPGRDRGKILVSYSSLIDKASNPRHSYIEDEIEIPRYPGLRKKERTAALPPGATSGNILHDLIEYMIGILPKGDQSDYPLPEKDLHTRSRELVQYYMGEQFTRDAVDEALSLSMRALSHTLPSLDRSVLGCHDRRAEIEFHASLRSLIKDREYYLHGFMDCVVRLEDRFYIIDWKSNYLESYDPFSIQEAMKHHSYDRQLYLYSNALLTILSSEKDDRTPWDRFGGIYYIFLRGLNDSNRDDGIFFSRPAEQQIENEVRKALGKL